MSLIAQMQQDLQQENFDTNSAELPLFAAADAIHQRKRISVSVGVVLVALLVPIGLLALAWTFAPSTETPPELLVDAALASTPAPSAPAQPNNEAAKPVVTEAPADQPVERTQPPSLKVDEAVAQAVKNTARLASATIEANKEQAPTDRAATPAVSLTASKTKVAASDNSASIKPQIIKPSEAPLPVTRPVARAKQTTVKRAPVQSIGVVKEVRPVTDAELDQKFSEQIQKGLQEGRASEAYRLLENRLTNADNMPVSATLLAGVLIDDGAFVRAQQLLDRYLVLYPASQQLRIKQLRLLVVQGLFAEALGSVDTFDSRLLKSIEVMELQAVSLQSIGDYEAASFVYQNLLVRNQDNARWWMGLAVAFDANAQTSEAKQAFVKALELRQLTAELSNYAERRVAQL
jgi:MSHA biogenesis protein MshN